MTVFDTGNGLLSFYADDGAEIIRIFDTARLLPSGRCRVPGLETQDESADG